MVEYTDIGKGEVIVLIHGLGSTKQAWERQHVLSDKYRLIIPNLRGHGLTEIDHSITLENMATDIIRLLERLNVKSAYICGLSLGGIVAQEIYKQRQDLVKGLVLSNTTFYIPSILRYGVIRDTKEALNQGKDKLIEYVVDKSLHNKEYIDEAKKIFLIRDNYLESVQAAIGYNYASTLMSIKIPTLLIGSTYDKVTPLLNTYMMKTLIRNSKMEILHSGHLSNIEKSEEFNCIVDKFLSELS